MTDTLNELKQIRDNIEQQTKRLAELEAQYKQEQKALLWSPKECEEVFVIWADSSIELVRYQEHLLLGAFLAGNIKRTEAEARAEVELRAVVHELKQCEGFRPFAFGRKNYGLQLRSGTLYVTWVSDISFSWQGCYYETAAQRDNAIAKVGGERILKAMRYSECGVV